MVKGWSKLGLVGRGVASPIFADICAGMDMHGSDIIRHSYDDDESMGPPDGLEDSNDTLGQRTCACAGVTMTKQQAGGEGAQGETLLQLTLVGAGRKGLTYPG